MRHTFDRGIAVVTGGAQGIGAGIVTRLALDGARVVVADIDLAGARARAREIVAAGGEACAIHLDVADEASMANLGPAVEAAFGETYRYMVCNAGVQTFQRAQDVSMADWERVLDVNARGTLLSLQAASRTMADGASIVAVASIQGRLGSPFYPHYSASKAAVISLVKSFALALAPRGIRVNSVAPGIIDTPLWGRADIELSKLSGKDAGAARTARIAGVPLGRAGTPEDVAASVSFLLSDDASYITGECIHICGGDLML